MVKLAKSARPKAQRAHHCLSGSGFGACRSQSRVVDSGFVFAQQLVFSACGTGAEARDGMAATVIEQEMSRQSRNRNQVALITGLAYHLLPGAINPRLKIPPRERALESRGRNNDDARDETKFC